MGERLAGSQKVSGSSPLSSTRHKALCDKKLHKAFFVAMVRRHSQPRASVLRGCCDSAKWFAERWASGGTSRIGKPFLSAGSRCFDRAPHSNIQHLPLPLAALQEPLRSWRIGGVGPEIKWGHYREREERTISSAICRITLRAD